MLAPREVPEQNDPFIATTGQAPAIGTHAERLNCPLMPLPHHQALPTLHIPPAHAPIAAATEQHRCGRTPGERIHDRARLAQGLPAFPARHLPDEDLPTASVSATTGQPRPIGPPVPAPAHPPMPRPRISRRP